MIMGQVQVYKHMQKYHAVPLYVVRTSDSNINIMCTNVQVPLCCEYFYTVLL